MRRVRDKTISMWEDMLTGRFRGETASWVRTMIHDFDPRVRAQMVRLVPAVVDYTITNLLTTLDEDPTLRLQVQAEGATTPDLAADSDGLAGEPYGRTGWIARFSQYPAEWAGIEQRSSDKGG
jgi:hypothetical protein